MAFKVTGLENLPNEIQLIILRYLRPWDQHYSFLNLNHRLNCLLECLRQPNQLEDLSDELQLILFRRYFILASLHSTFFGLNYRYNILLTK